MLAIRINTGEDTRVFLTYGPLAKKGLEPCYSLGVPPPEQYPLSAVVKRMSDTEWLVEAQTARVTEYIGNDTSCLGYVDMPVRFTINYRPPDPE